MIKVNRNMYGYCSRIAEKRGIPEETVKNVLKKYVSTIKESLVYGESFNLGGVTTITVFWDEEKKNYKLRARTSESLKEYVRSDEQDLREASGVPRDSQVIAKTLGVTKKTTNYVLKDFIQFIREDLKENKPVTISGVITIEFKSNDKNIRTSHCTTEKSLRDYVNYNKRDNVTNDTLYSERYKQNKEERKIAETFFEDATVSDEELEMIM